VAIVTVWSSFSYVLLHYRDFEKLTLALGEVLAAQMPGLPASCIQVDEANIPGNPSDAPLAAEAIESRARRDRPRNGTRRALLLPATTAARPSQKGNWKKLLAFLNALHTDHLVLELMVMFLNTWFIYILLRNYLQLVTPDSGTCLESHMR
jgi:hypothetical protein